jgi:modification methylase
LLPYPILSKKDFIFLIEICIDKFYKLTIVSTFMEMNKVYFHTAENIHEIPDNTIRLAVASPPFTNNPDGKTLDKIDYGQFLNTVYQECFRTLMPGGVLVSLNTDLKDHGRYNRGDRSYEGSVWLKHAAIREVVDGLGFKQFDYKIWAKALTENRFRFNFSHLLFFEKPGSKRFRHHPQKHTRGFGPSVWDLKDSMQRRDSTGYKFPDAIHPEISRRCIREFTQEGDIVLSPFTGSGTILATAEELGRNWIGYEINTDLERLITESIYGPRPKAYEV